MTNKPSIEERFWAKVHKTDQCWLWVGSKQGFGYGYLHSGTKENRKPIRTHRFSWELHNGPIPEGAWVLHKCDNPSCVNPDHLFIGDRSANMIDCAKKGRLSIPNRWLKTKKPTHCKRGHEYTKENTRIAKEGHRICRACQKENKEKFLAKAIRATKEPE